jgi:2-succinyl-6-hydroxy-2,4-cyclohexadiene-1-carboxylate synthase
MTSHEINGVGMWVDDAGDGPPLLLLHGFTGSGSSWADHVPAFRARHRTIAVDLLGHGASDAPADPDRYAVERQAGDIALLLDRLDATPADVLGYSMGARIALRLALDHPRVARRLVLESPSAGIDGEHERADRRRADEELAALLERDGVEPFVDRWEAEPVLAAQRSLPAATRRRLRRERLGQRAAGLAASLRGAGQGTAAPVGHLLGRIDLPALIICGATDWPGIQRAERVAAGIAGSRLTVIPGAGHTPHLEQAEAFRSTVLEFLDQPMTHPPIAADHTASPRFATR